MRRPSQANEEIIVGKIIKAVLFDFGGVIADEGFYEGLLAIGKKNGLDPQAFFVTVETLIHDSGYLVGTASEETFWNAVRRQTGISGDDDSLREEILNRFVIRPAVLSHADVWRSRGAIVAMLSDQTNWLDEINARTSLFSHFDRVFNSYHIHKSKREASVFADVCRALGVHRGETLFIDDNIDHISRARGQGLQTIHFTTKDDFETQLRAYRQ